MIRSVRCSLTKVTLTLLVIVLLVVIGRRLFGEGRRHSYVEEEEDGTSYNNRERHLRSAASTDESPSDKGEDVEFVEVMRIKPKVSFSMSSTLDKLLDEERRIHNPGSVVAEKEGEGDGSVSRMGIKSLIGVDGSVMPGNNLNHLKSALKDPSFLQKIKNIESRRQVKLSNKTCMQYMMMIHLK